MNKQTWLVGYVKSCSQRHPPLEWFGEEETLLSAYITLKQRMLDTNFEYACYIAGREPNNGERIKDIKTWKRGNYDKLCEEIKRMKRGYF